MAERITKTRECDRGGCRRRKGVEAYDLVLSADPGGVMYSASGELCPAHMEMVARFINNQFKNTKD